MEKKEKKAILIPYEHWKWGVTQRVWVDKDDMHPDPNKLLIWGLNDCGENVADFKKSFSRKGEPVSITYDISGAFTASEEEKRKRNAIKNYISSLHACEKD